MQTSELADALLDFWVAKAEGLRPEMMPPAGPCLVWGRGAATAGPVSSCERRYSADWTHGGPILEANDWLLPFRTPEHRLHRGAYTSQTQEGVKYCGPTPLVAAMRAYVAAKFGPDLPDPGDLASRTR
ncbi:MULTISPECIES: phage protein NinX family protein [unclassified Variovorax]|uniref:phage protein NinX family protein n=1 Tax=unclassified Variovorax TaxID=663243 RepID=UPI000B83A37B